MSCSTNQGRNFSFVYNQSSCIPCNSGCNTNIPVNTDDVIYTGGNLSCITITPNSNLSDILLLLAQAICAGGDPNPDYSGYDTACLVNDSDAQIQTQSEFVKSISNFVCTLRSDLDTFSGTTYTAAIAALQASINSINAPGLTSCGSVNISSGDNLHTVLSKLSTAACDLYTKINPSSADWTQCYAVSAPTTIVGAFDTVIDMICTLKAIVTAGVVLPTFNNVGSCLPTPLTTTDTLVSTIGKIKTKLCQLPVFDYSSLNYGCVASATTLQATVQNIMTSLSGLMTNSVLTFDPAYFTVTPIDAMDLCQGNQVTLASPLVDRFVAANSADSSPGTLIDKVVGDGTYITVDDTTNAGQITVSLVPSVLADNKVKVNGSDPLNGYLSDKLIGGSASGFALSVVTDALTDPTDFKSVITPVINWTTFIETILLTINSDTYLKSLFCTINCTSTPPAYYKIQLSNTGATDINVNLSLIQDTPSLTIHSGASPFNVAASTSYTPAPVAVTSNSIPIQGGIRLTNNEAFTIQFNVAIRDNSGSILPSSTTASGGITAGSFYDVTTPGFGYGTSPDDYNIIINMWKP